MTMAFFATRPARWAAALLDAVSGRGTAADRRPRDGGQGTLEYVGMIVAAVVVLAAVIAVIGDYDLAGRIQRAFDSVFTR